MEAIEDSLDEKVDESHYRHPEIQQVFELIERDKVSLKIVLKCLMSTVWRR